MPEQTVFTVMDSPLGEILLAQNDRGLSHICFKAGDTVIVPEDSWRQDDVPFVAAVEQLEAYFAGDLIDFDLLLAPKGTLFQQEVWHFLQTIPYGQTISYGAIAQAMGNPNATRAVGAANGRNPIPIIIPCHRVIGSNGKLTGYAGGLQIKQALLSLERNGRIEVPQQLSLF
ncbi:MAG: methylated-DNA--[protein]-cysteine S-methyltransferase [Chloroflexi bacterium]|nr:methylated-DNA--[protein]-cysteine S-methyltransferase [Chloroflexota bacterium]